MADNELELQIAIAEAEAKAKYKYQLALAERDRAALDATADVSGGMSEPMRIASQGLRGIVGMAGMAGDVARNAPLAFNVPEMVRRAASEKSMYTPLGTTAQPVLDALTAGGYIQEPQTFGGRIAGKIAEFLAGNAATLGAGAGLKIAGKAPSLASALLKRIPTQLSGTALSGLFAGTAEEAGAGPGVQLAASLLGPTVAGGVSNAGRNAYDAFTTRKIAPQIAAAETIRTSTGLQAGDIAEALSKQPVDDLAQYASTAEITQNPQMASMQRVLGMTGPDASAKVTARAAARDAARESMLTDLAPANSSTSEALGSAMRAAADARYTRAKDAASKLFKTIDPKGTTSIPIGSAKKAVTNVQKELFGEGGGKLKGEAAEVFKELSGAPNSKSWKFLQNVRSRAYEAAEDAAARGKNREAAVMRTVVDQIDKAGMSAAKTGTGFTPKQAEQWKKAHGAWKQVQQTFREGKVGKLLTEDRVVNSQIVDRVFDGTPESVRQLKAAVGGGSKSLMQLRRALIDSVKRDAGDQLTSAKFKSFLTKHKEALPEVFAKSHIQRLHRIADDLKSEASLSKLGARASKGQSQTAENLTALSAIRGVAQGRMAFRHPVLARIGRTLFDSVAKSKDAQIESLLLDAALDPRYAKELLEIATPERVESLMKLMSREMPRAAALSEMSE